MAKTYNTIGELIVDLLLGHFDATKVDDILSDAGTILDNQAKILEGQAAAKLVQDQTAADVLAIKVFMGIPDARIVATQDDLNKLGQKLAGDTAAATQFDQTMNPAPVASITEALPT